MHRSLQWPWCGRQCPGESSKVATRGRLATNTSWYPVSDVHWTLHQAFGTPTEPRRGSAKTLKCSIQPTEASAHRSAASPTNTAMGTAGGTASTPCKVTCTARSKRIYTASENGPVCGPSPAELCICGATPITATLRRFHLPAPMKHCPTAPALPPAHHPHLHMGPEGCRTARAVHL